MQLVLHYIKGDIKHLEDVDALTIFDLSYQGEIGIYTNHKPISGMGEYFVYQQNKQEGSFFYSVVDNKIHLYLL